MSHFRNHDSEKKSSTSLEGKKVTIILGNLVDAF